MHDKVYVIQQDPLGLVVPLDMRRADACVTESLLDFIGDGLNLSRVATRADKKIVGEGAAGFVQFQHRDFLSLLLLGSADRFQYLVSDFGSFGHEFQTVARPKLRPVSSSPVRRPYDPVHCAPAGCGLRVQS